MKLWRPNHRPGHLWLPTRRICCPAAYAPASGGFTPPPGSPVGVYVADPTYLFTDSGKTTHAADGDLVYTWADASGNGNDLVQATSGNRFTAKQGGDGKWYLDGSAGSRWMKCAGLAIDKGQFAAYLNADILEIGRDGTGTESTQLSFGADLSTYLSIQQQGSAALDCATNSGSFGNVSKVTIREGVVRYAWTATSGGTAYLDNERYSATGSTPTAGTVTGLYLNTWGGFQQLSSSETNFCGRTKIRSCVLYSGVDHGSTEIAAVRSWSDTYGTPAAIPTTGPLLVVFGDSRALGVPAASSSTRFTNAIPGLLRANLTGSPTVVSYGIPGASAGLLNSTYAADLAAFLSGRGGQTNIAVVMAGVNPTSYTYSDFSALCATLQGQGWLVVVAVEPPADGTAFWSGGTAWAAYVAAQIANSPDTSDATARLDQVAGVGDNHDAHNATQTDGLHWTEAGNALMDVGDGTHHGIRQAVQGLIP